MEKKDSSNNLKSIVLHETQPIQALKTTIVKANDYSFRIPDEILKLLFISNEEPPEGLGIFTVSIRIDFQNGITFDSRTDSTDPSTIFLMSRIRRPKPSEIIEKPGYYPTYLGLSPEQKWYYLSWLENIHSPIDIGYVFIFYYGLERHLLIGDYDSAFETILELRKAHINSSFQAYSKSAIIYSTIIRNRRDRLQYLEKFLSNERWTNEELLIAFSQRESIEANELIRVIACLPECNKSYVNKEPNIYMQQLSYILNDKYGRNAFPVKDCINIKDIPRKKHLCFANISFPDKVRSLEVPSILDYPKVRESIVQAASLAHENTKSYLKEHRKAKGRIKE
jgi:hypothetical protein